MGFEDQVEQSLRASGKTTVRRSTSMTLLPQKDCYWKAALWFSAMASDIGNQCDDGSSHLAVLQLTIGSQQSQCPGDDKQFEWRLMPLTFIVGCCLIVRAEKRAHRHPEYLGDLCQSASANPVHASFVLLDLLKRYAKLVCECCLR